MDEQTAVAGWDTRSLTDLAQYHNGLAFKPSDWGEEGTKIIRIEQLNNPTGDYDYFGGPFPETSRIEDGDLIFSWSATLKAVIWRHGSGVLNQHLFKVIPNADVDKHFLYYLLAFNMDALGGGSHGSTMKHIKRGELRTYNVEAPPLPQQRKIAKILTTVDNLIEKTEALIAKYQAIKQGLMHDLFTRGVDEHGHLRPPYDEAPELYKESELGWIPREWKAVTLRDEIDILHGYAFVGEFFADSPPGEVLLVPGNFHRNGGLYFTAENTKYFRGPVPPQTVLGNGDLVTVMTDLSPRTLILGRVAEVNLPFPLLHNQRIGVVRTKRDQKWNRRFLLFALNDERLRKEIILTATGTTVRHTSPTRILTNRIPKPRKPEQDRVAESLDQIERTICSESERVEKLRTTKLGLMQDLLTGKVRVKVDGNAEDV